MKKPDPDLLRKMMMGDYSAVPEDDKHSRGFVTPSKVKSSLDLHAEKLFAGKKVAANETLSAQLAALNKYLEDCRMKHKRKTIIIHGKGDDILRKEVHQLLTKTAFVASFSLIIDTPYFGGATRVSLK
jgi:DNA-nicking Smr family endonuclease